MIKIILYPHQEDLNLKFTVITPSIKALSVVTADRNEVWFLLPHDSDYSIIMIYDYLKGCWVKRKSQKINAINIINGKLYSAGRKIP